MANERHTDFREWEIDSSTRQSVHPYTKYAPFRSALSTTASTLKSVGQGEIATNWVTNPRIEAADITMYTVTGGDISRSTGQQAVGAASLLTDPDNSAAGEGWYWTSPTIPFSIHPQHISVQLEHRGASASGAVTLTLRDSTGVTTLATSGTSNLAASWTRVTAQYTVPPSTAATVYRFYLVTTAQHNINFYADKIMFELREDTNTVSTYVDGDSGLNHSWTGTANASTSRKHPDMTVIKGIQIKNESGTSAEIVYVAFDQTASTTTGIPILAGATFETNWPLYFNDKVSVISASGTPTVSGVIWGTHNG